MNEPIEDNKNRESNSHLRNKMARAFLTLKKQQKQTQINVRKKDFLNYSYTDRKPVIFGKFESFKATVCLHQRFPN